MGRNGEWFAYKTEPTTSECYWCGGHYHVGIKQPEGIEAPEDWTKSLMKVRTK